MYVLFVCAGWGVWLRAAYELIAVWRRWCSPSKGAVFAVDVLTLAAAGVATFVWLLAVSDGQLSLEAVIGIPVGVFAAGKFAKKFSKRG